MKEAMFYRREADGRVRCELCRFTCLIADGQRGICAVRENRGGTLYSLVYGRLCAASVDPIEKKPFFHVLPGSRAYSIATVGCNFHCRHCQNFTISQPPRDQPIGGVVISPATIVAEARANGCRSIAYTYTEPTIFIEYALDTARLAKEAGLLNLFVTNGYIGPQALATIAPYLDAANIDLKGFTETFYQKVVKARLSQVLETILDYRRHGIWLEITTLLIPGLNDSDAELKGLADFIVTNLGADTPWHVSRFYPTYQLTDRPPTPLATLQRAREIGLAAGLHYVYEGNVPGAGGENTLCPGCAAAVILREGYTIVENRLREGACPDCGTVLTGRGL